MAQPNMSPYIHPRFWPTRIGLGLLWCIAMLPHSWRRAIGYFLGRQLLMRNRKRVEIADTNLAWCFRDKSAAERQQIRVKFFQALGHSILEYGFIWWRSDTALTNAVTFRGIEIIEQLRRQNQPIVLVTGHSLYIDIAGLTLSKMFSMASFANNVRNPLLNRLLHRGRTRFGGEMIQRDQGLRPLLKMMKQRGMIYIIADEDFGTENSVFAPFFGIQKSTLITPPRLAKMSKATLIPCFCHYDREQQVYVMQFGEPFSEISDNDVENCSASNHALEQFIRQSPHDYMWSLRLFQTRPRNHPAPYRFNHDPDAGPRDPIAGIDL